MFLYVRMCVCVDMYMCMCIYRLFICRLCNKEINTQSNTTNLNRHCEKEHRKEWEAESGKENKETEREKNKQQKIEINEGLVCNTPIRNKEAIDKLIIGNDYKLIKLIIISLV